MMKTPVMNETSVKTSVVAADLMLVNSQSSLLLVINYHPIRQPEPKLVQVITEPSLISQLNPASWIVADSFLNSVMDWPERLNQPFDDELKMAFDVLITSVYQANTSRLDQDMSSLHDEHKDLLQYYILRILLKAGGVKEFINQRGFRHDNVASFLGIQGLEEGYEVNPIKAKYVMQELLNQCSMSQRLLHPKLTESLCRLKQELSLTDVDVAIFTFAIFLHADSLLDDTADLLNSLTANQLFRYLAVILDLPEADVRLSLSNKSMLTRAGLVKVDYAGAQRMRSKLELINQNAFDLMMDEQFHPLDLLKNRMMLSDTAELTLSDYGHFEKPLSVLVPYLNHALSTKQTGVNIFLYGEPGTGKTQFVRTIAQALSAHCYEVTTMDSDGDPISAEQRLTACAGAQHLLKDAKVLLMFDEVEDVFTRTAYRDTSPAEARKAWFNNLLETNAVPTIWISNKSYGIDPAFIRRFDMVFEMPMPEPEQRAKMLTQYSDGLVSEEAKARFAKHEHLAPAIIERTTKVIKPIAAQLTVDSLDDTFEMLVNNTLKLQDHRPVERKKEVKKAQLSHYNPAYINANTNMQAVAESLKEHSEARICLYGPPGTGKTAYGHYLAEQLGKPLHLKRASDLLDMYVGGTEANMAKAFKKAQEQGAILLIDEVDSFIFDRGNAVRSWEVSAVNEMLTQMEAFEGIFIASTNRMDGLDAAALRRFDLKVKVDYLTYEQRVGLFRDTCAQLELESHEAVEDNLISLTNLTPGDFALVVRQHKFKRQQNAEQLFSALSEEAKLKGLNVARIGF